MEIKYPNWLPKYFSAPQKPEEMNDLVDVIDNNARLLAKTIDDIELIQVGINGKVSPETTIYELAQLPDGLYRAEREGNYLFDPPIIMGEVDGIQISDNNVPVGFVVDFLKNENKWSLGRIAGIGKINGDVKPNETRLVNGDKVYNSIQKTLASINLNFGGEIIDLNQFPEGDGMYLPRVEGVYTNFNNLSYFANEGFVCFVIKGENISKTSIPLNQTIENEVNPNNLVFALNGRAVYEFTTQKINTIADLRNTVGKEEGQVVELLGYNSAGDKEPVKYKWFSGQIPEDGGVIIHAGDGCWCQVVDTLLNVRDFGAVGDGITDDSDAIQNAFNSYFNKTVIYFPAGFYKITKKITIPESKEFVIEGARSVSDGGTTPETRFNGISSILWYGENHSDDVMWHFIDTQSRVRMRFLNFSNRTSRTDVDGLRFNDFRGAYLENVYVNLFRRNIDIVGDCWYAKVEKSKFMQAKDYNVYVKGLSNGLKFEECRISSSDGVGAYFEKSASDVLFDGCYIEQNRLEGLIFNKPQVINLVNCHFENNGYDVLEIPRQIYITNYTDLNNSNVVINLTGNYFFTRGGVNIIQTLPGALGVGSKMVCNLNGNFLAVNNDTKGVDSYMLYATANVNNILLTSVNNSYLSLSAELNTPKLTNVLPLQFKSFVAIGDNSTQTDSIGMKSNRILTNRLQFTNDFENLGASIICDSKIPNGNYVGTVGSIYIDSSSGLDYTDRIYVKESGTSNSGWVKFLKKSQAVNSITSVDATDLTTALTLVNELKSKNNDLLTKLKSAGIMNQQ